MYQNDMQIPKSHDALFIVGERSITLMHVVPIRLEPTDRLHGRSKVHLFEETDIRTGLNQRPVGPNLCIGTTAPVNSLNIASGRIVVGPTDIGNTTTSVIISGSATNGSLYGLQAGQDSSHNLSLGWFANSTASNGYSFVGSFSGNNPLVLQNGGGNVGIGTTAPDTMVHIAADKANIANSMGQLLISGATNKNQQLILGYDTTNNYAMINALKQNDSYKPLALQPNGGNVGIGTTNPTVNLQVESSSTASTDFRLKNSSTNGRSWVISSLGQSSSLGAGKLNIFDESGGGSRLTIDTSGAVGIGTTAPSTALQVNGTITATNIVTTNPGSCSWTGWQCGSATCSGSNVMRGFNMGWYNACGDGGGHYWPNYMLYCCAM